MQMLAYVQCFGLNAVMHSLHAVDAWRDVTSHSGEQSTAGSSNDSVAA
jgi:hypothetical protein